jgi:hypothetical protein
MSYGRFVALAVLLVCVLWALGWIPTERLAGERGPAAMIAGGLLGLLASLLGTLPMALIRGRRPVDAVPAVLGSVALRLALVLFLVLGVAVSGIFATTPLLLWAVISHMGLLVVDTLFARSRLRALDEAARAQREPNGTGPGGPEPEPADPDPLPDRAT